MESIKKHVRSPQGVRMRFAVAFVVCTSVGALLSACQASPEVGFWSGSDRCVTAQAIVGETAEQDASGNVSAAAPTKSRFGGCTGDRSFGSDIYALESEATLVKRRVDGSGTFICATDLDLTIGANFYDSSAAAVSRCGYGNYYAVGWHHVIPSVGADRETNTQSPDGYNA